MAKEPEQMSNCLHRHLSLEINLKISASSVNLYTQLPPSISRALSSQIHSGLAVWERASSIWKPETETSRIDSISPFTRSSESSEMSSSVPLSLPPTARPSFQYSRAKLQKRGSRTSSSRKGLYTLLIPTSPFYRVSHS